ncbi:hypothetical protein BpHYR1_047735 [Brachionus plicatilis]|uniref:Uncharacterized protein n=1 Tax=Brachionus plicatilis TaxID=10195 RepID=A0A3M7PMT0_BRAPC|nr:hypothetical protein BpHYR1_047735 [Brachionus plicatilis]
MLLCCIQKEERDIGRVCCGATSYVSSLLDSVSSELVLNCLSIHLIHFIYKNLDFQTPDLHLTCDFCTTLIQSCIKYQGLLNLQSLAEIKFHYNRALCSVLLETSQNPFFKSKT